MQTTTETSVLLKVLRTNLKTLVAKELQQLPSYIEGLTPKEKLDYLLKLMPYVFPKVESVNYRKDEPISLSLDDY